MIGIDLCRYYKYNGIIKGTTMTTTRFISYICYSITCPEGITPERWSGMLTWARTNGYI